MQVEAAIPQQPVARQQSPYWSPYPPSSPHKPARHKRMRPESVVASRKHAYVRVAESGGETKAFHPNSAPDTERALSRARVLSRSGFEHTRAHCNKGSRNGSKKGREGLGGRKNRMDSNKQQQQSRRELFTFRRERHPCQPGCATASAGPASGQRQPSWPGGPSWPPCRQRAQRHCVAGSKTSQHAVATFVTLHAIRRSPSAEARQRNADHARLPAAQKKETHRWAARTSGFC